MTAAGARVHCSVAWPGSFSVCVLPGCGSPMLGHRERSGRVRTGLYGARKNTWCRYWAMTQPSQPEFLQPPARIDGQITLAEADPGWAAQYARQEERIQIGRASCRE